jgi:hypothetical protein
MEALANGFEVACPAAIGESDELKSPITLPPPDGCLKDFRKIMGPE